MEKEKSEQAENMNEIFLSVLLLISMLVLVDFEIIGMRLNIFLLFLLSLVYICYGMVFRRNDNRFLLIPQKPVDFVVLALIGWNLLAIIGKLFQDLTLGVIDYKFEVTCIVFSLLYFLFKKNKELHDWYFDLIIYLGLFVIVFMLFCYLYDMRMMGILSEIMNDSGKCASYLLLPCTACVCRYNMCRDKRSSLFYMLTAAMGFFTLLINHNIISLWLMSIVFFAAPVLIRPTAEFIKRNMQLCFIFFFMMGNIGLLTNYTHLIQKEMDISLGVSIYLDLLIAAGGVLFYIYWSRIPEGVDRDGLAMKKMRRGYAATLLMTGTVFMSFVTGGDRWKELPDAMMAAMAKSFAVPLIDEIGKNKNAWIYYMESSSVSALFLLISVSLLEGMIIKNYSLEKPLTGSFMLISAVFFMETIFFAPSSNILPVYLLILVMAAFGREKNQQEVAGKKNFPKEITNS